MEIKSLMDVLRDRFPIVYDSVYIAINVCKDSYPIVTGVVVQTIEVNTIVKCQQLAQKWAQNE